MNFSYSGIIEEERVKLKLIEFGYEVALPIFNAPYDLLVRSCDDKWLKIQIKKIQLETQRTKNVVRKLNIRKCGTYKTQKYEKDDVDYFIGVDGMNFYIISHAEVLGQWGTNVNSRPMNNWKDLPKPYNYVESKLEIIDDSQEVMNL